MTEEHRSCGVAFESLVDYSLGDLPAHAAETLEAHLFDCAACARAIETVGRIAAAVRDAVRHASVGVVVNGAFLERAASDGLTFREYRIPEGNTVACSAGPEDFVVVRIAADFGAASDLRLDATFEDLERDERSPLPVRRIVADREAGEIVLVFPGAAVRAYPRSRWTLRVHGELPSGPAEYGPFVMDHTPQRRDEKNL